ncbi:MAG: hypothetical protein L0L93_06490, partial [Brevibacterium sp.]|nr:hypothetical protein [Brevibacterium sp.]
TTYDIHQGDLLIDEGSVDERDRRSTEAPTDHPRSDRSGRHGRSHSGVEFGARDLEVIGEGVVGGKQEFADPADAAALAAVPLQELDSGPDPGVLVEDVPHSLLLLLGQGAEVDGLVQLAQTLDSESSGGLLTGTPPVPVPAFAV